MFVSLHHLAMAPELNRIQGILSSFLGNPKNDMSDEFELEFGCPRCEELYGRGEHDKFNLAINVRKGVFKCWKCENETDEMHGSITKLVKTYGSEGALKEYREAIEALRNSDLYKLKFDDGDFNADFMIMEREELEFPSNYKKLVEGGNNPKRVMEYLTRRGIGWDIITKHSIGYTGYDENNRLLSNRIILPSYDADGTLNYWTGRDFTGNSKRMKYANPSVERKDIVFNEELLQWDADITIVEGPFDHIVVPNSVPLLGKVIKSEFRLYRLLMDKARANVNIFLDNDAYETAIKTYRLLNHGNLYNRIRLVPSRDGEDPSSIYQEKGYRGIAEHLRNSYKVSEVYLS